MIQINIRFAHLLTFILALLALVIGRQVVAGQEGDQSAVTVQPGNAFTYQGYLEDESDPVDGQSCDFQFSLYDAADGTTALAGPLTRTAELIAGVFTVNLDFGDAFNGEARFLGIAARCPAGAGEYEDLSPHQKLTAVPYAMSAPWSGISSMPAGFADGIDDANWLNRAAPPSDTVITTVDDSGIISSTTSITIGADGMAVISYYDDFDKDLRVLHCKNLACTNSSWAIVDSAGDVGEYSSIAIGADGLPIISYYDATNGDLKVAHCQDPDCSSNPTRIIVDAVGDVGQYSSIAVGANGFPVISYYDVSDANLKLAICGDINCSTTANTQVFGYLGELGKFSSVTIADGHPIISFIDDTFGLVYILYCHDIVCSNHSSHTVNYPGRAQTSIVIGADGIPLLSYHRVDGLRVFRCDIHDCHPSQSDVLVDSSGDTGYHSSATIGADGLPIISYYDATNFVLKVAHCRDIACSTGATITVLDKQRITGQYSSITIGTDGLPIISYLDASNNHLRVAHCGNQFCTPFFRRR